MTRSLLVRRLAPAVSILAVLAAAVVAAPPGRSRTRERTDERTAQRQPVNRFGLSRPLPRTPGAIRLATYNTLNLFDHVDDPALAGEHDDRPMATSDDRCRALADAIRAIDADIIALQEVESLDALTWFRDTYLADLGYRWIASHDVGYYRGVECSLMSRFEITRSRVWLRESLEHVKREGPGWSPVPPGQRPTFQRSPLMAEVRAPDGYELTVFSIHHKAGDFAWQREAEALRIVQFIDEVRAKDPSRNLVVMGDFNAAPWDKSVRVYLKAGMIDTLAHRIWHENNPESAQYKTHESDRTLDYILLNSAAHRELVIGSPFVYGTLAPPPQYNWREDTPPPGYASDHYPVVVDLMPRDRP
jgi:endonuclease/exonuclease/phosphatase family metal-dependent hydrolase